MSKTMANVDQRTQLAGKNRFEMLLFYMGGRRRFGINVFKVREVIPAPRITQMPDAHSAVRGIAHVRGQTIAMIDLCFATTGRALPADRASSVIVTEYNRTTQGFLVEGVDRIQNVNWQDVMPPPERVANRAYLTAVTEIDGELVQIVDVEKVLAEIATVATPGEEVAFSAPLDREQDHLLVVDDSLVARNQIRRALEPAGWEVTVAKNGQEALELLQRWAGEDGSPLGRTAVVISDIEMPRMDGYALASAIRQDERLRHLRVLLHTSLSGVFNRSMVEQVGADDFLPKFDAGELANKVSSLLAS
ncbi:MAG TPA: chemotaxis protein [Gammaproteobacteria bacterium]|nr:chemotaxis protein [Gammaproteobacteria bacterium]